MLKLHKVSRLVLITISIVLLMIPLTAVTAHADVGDTLYIVIDMQGSFVYNASIHEPVSIKYYNNPLCQQEHEVSPNPSEITIQYFETTDLINPLGGPPKDVGTYELRVNYHSANTPPDYDDAVAVHNYSITKADLTIDANSNQSKTYNNGTAADPVYTYSFDESCWDVLATEFSGMGYSHDDIKAEMLSGSLNRVEGQDVGAYDITLGTLSLVDPYSNNYSIVFNKSQFTINKATLTITNISIDNKEYDATADGVISTSGSYYLSGTFDGDSETDVYLDLSQATAVFNTFVVGTNIDVILSGYELKGPRAFNYDVQTPPPYKADIDKRQLDISAHSVSRVYDPNHSDGVLDYDINIEDLNVLETEFATEELSEIKGKFNGALSRTGTNNAGSYTVQQGTLGIADPGIGNFNTSNYSINFTTAEYNISQYQLDVSVDAGQSKIYGEADPIFAYTLSDTTPLYEGDSFTGALSRTAGADAGIYDIELGTLTVNDNYIIILSDNIGAFEIEKKAITIKADNQSSAYGDPLVTPLTYTLTVGSLADGDSFTGALEKADGLTAGAYAITIGTLSIDKAENYNITFIEGIYTIGKVMLDISVDPDATLRKRYCDDEDPVIAFILSPGTPVLSGHTIGGSLGRAEGRKAALYALNTDKIVILDAAEEDVTDNYSFTLDDSKPDGGTYMFEIYREEIYISIDIPLSTPFKDQPVNALPWFFDNPECTDIVNITEAYFEIYYYIKGNSTPLLYTPSIPGLYTVTVDFLGTNNYLPKIQSEDYEITKAILTISGISVQNKTYDTTVNGVISGTPVISGVHYDETKVALVTTGATAIFENRNVSKLDKVIIDKNVTVTGYSLSGEHAAYYQIAQPMTFSAKINPVNLNIAAHEVIREYNPLKPEGVLNYNINSALNLLAIEFGSSNITIIKSNMVGALHRDAGSSMGTYKINQGTLAMPPALSDNYNIVYTGANYHITPINLIITIVPEQSKVYGEADPATIQYTYDENKLLYGDRMDGGLIRVAGNNAGNYNILLGTLTVRNSQGVDVGDSGQGNYKVSIINSPFIIKKRPITIRANNTSIKYGEEHAALSDYISSGSLAYTDTLTGSITRSPGNNAGTYQILQGNRSITNSSNYSITFINGVYTINPKIVMLKVDPEAILSKTYGGEDPEISFLLQTPLIEGHVIGGSLGREEGENAQHYALNTSKVIVRDANDAIITANYTFTLDTRMENQLGNYQFTINKKQLTVKAKNIPVTKGNSYNLKIEISGFVKGETKDDLDVIFVAQAVSPEDLLEGENIITITTKHRLGGTITEDKNYSITKQNGIINCVYPENVPDVSPYPVDSAEFKKNNSKFKGFTYYKGVMLYDVNTVSGEKPSRANIKVTIDLPEKLLEAKKVSMLYISPEKVSVIVCTLEEGKATFVLDGTGMYLMAKPVSGFFIIILPALGIAGVITGIVFFIRYRKKNKVKRFKPSKASLKAKKEGSVVLDDVHGLKRDFTGEGFDSIIDTGEGTGESIDYYSEGAETLPVEDEKKDKKSKREERRKKKIAKHSKDVIVMEELDLNVEKEVSLEQLIEKPSEAITPTAPAAANIDNIEEEEFLGVLKRASKKKDKKEMEKAPEPIPEVKAEPIAEPKIVKKEKKTEDLSELLDELNKAEPKPAKDTVKTGIFGNVEQEFGDLISSDKNNALSEELLNSESAPSDMDSFNDYNDEDDDLVPPAQKKAKAKPDYSSFESLDYEDDGLDDLKPLVSKKPSSKDKITVSKAVPNATSPKKPISDKNKNITNDFGNMNDLDHKEIHDQYKKSNEGKIVRQGGARRFDDDDK